jgi:protein-disulfide isomerase
MMMAWISRRAALAAFTALVVAACGDAGGSAGAAPANGMVDGEPGFARGSEDAPITLIEYASPTCPVCKYFHETIKPVIDENYVETGKVRYIFREFPLNEIDVAAYALARCAGEDRYLDVIEDFFTNQDGVRAAVGAGAAMVALTTIAQRHGIADEAAVNACISNPDIRRSIADSVQASEKHGVSGTPTFVLNGNVREFSGDYRTAEGFSRQLDALLATAESN